MYTFLLTMCALIAVFGFMAIALDRFVDSWCNIDEEVMDYGEE